MEGRLLCQELGKFDEGKYSSHLVEIYEIGNGMYLYRKRACLRDRPKIVSIVFEFSTKYIIETVKDFDLLRG